MITDENRSELELVLVAGFLGSVYMILSVEPT